MLSVQICMYVHVHLNTHVCLYMLGCISILSPNMYIQNEISYFLSWFYFVTTIHINIKQK